MYIRLYTKLGSSQHRHACTQLVINSRIYLPNICTRAFQNIPDHISSAESTRPADIYTREIRDINRHIYKFIYGQFYMYMHIHLVTLLASLFIACLDIQVHVCVHGPVHRHVYAYTAAAGRSLISFLACLLHSLLYGTNAHTYNLILACLPCLARDVHGGHATSSAKPAWFWYLDLE